MAQVRKFRRQCTFHEDVAELVRSGGNVTHILTVRILNPRTSEEAKRIRRRIYQSIANVPRYQNVKGLYFPITWRTSAQNTPEIYHCDLRGMIGDMAVREHSKALLSEVLNALDEEFDHIFSRKITVVSFWVTKPLAREVCLIY